MVLDPSLIQQVCNNPQIYSKDNLPGYSLLRFVLGDGLVTLDGNEHKVHRKLMNPAFKV